jgi:hypothetical protein
LRGPFLEALHAHGSSEKLAVLQSKFAAYLSWSQPFIHHLVAGLDPYVRNVIACNRTENLDRFPVREVIRFPDRYLFEPRLAVLAAAHVKRQVRAELIHAHFFGQSSFATRASGLPFSVRRYSSS